MSGFRRGGGGRKRDANEGPIVDALRACGGYVLRIGGDGSPDLLVKYGRRWTPLEVKRKGGRRTASQVAAGAGELWPVVETVDDALRAVGIVGDRHA